MRIRTGIAAAVAATAMVLGAGSAAVAADGPKTVTDDRPTVVEGGDPTDIGINVLCGIGLLGGGVCSNN